MVDLPRSVEDISSAWLSRVLGRAVSVRGVEQIGVDEGFTGGGLYRLRCDQETLIAKLSPSDPRLSEDFKAANAREVQFYTQFVQDDRLPVPRCHHGAFDANTGASVLIIEDVGAGRSVPFTAGCSLRDAERVVDALARIHAAFWQAPELVDVQGVETLDEFDFTDVWERYADAVGDVLGCDVPSSVQKLGDYFAHNRHSVFGRLLDTEPMTLLHRDVQVDNILFHDDTVSILDWQFVGKGRGAYDLAYFLISSLDPAVRRGHEKDLLQRYVAGLGRADYGFEQCWQDYILGVFGKINVTVVATVLLDNTGSHKQAWRRADLDRVVAFCEDHQITPESLDVSATK